MNDVRKKNSSVRRETSVSLFFLTPHNLPTHPENVSFLERTLTTRDSKSIANKSAESGGGGAMDINSAQNSTSHILGRQSHVENVEFPSPELAKWKYS